jgi:hypothetical protein
MTIAQALWICWDYDCQDKTVVYKPELLSMCTNNQFENRSGKAMLVVGRLWHTLLLQICTCVVNYIPLSM